MSTTGQHRRAWPPLPEVAPPPRCAHRATRLTAELILGSRILWRAGRQPCAFCRRWRIHDYARQGRTRARKEDSWRLQVQERRLFYRLGKNCDLIVDNPELELDKEPQAADAVLLYRFDAQAGEHILRLLDPLADHAHVKVHRRDD